ncbi:hypothetical protein Tco_0307605 [Tanacetum coccineum]
MEHETEKMKSPKKMKSPEKNEEEDVDTQEEIKEVVKETGAKRKKSIPRKSIRKRQKMEKDAEKEELKGTCAKTHHCYAFFLNIVLELQVNLQNPDLLQYELKKFLLALLILPMLDPLRALETFLMTELTNQLDQLGDSLLNSCVKEWTWSTESSENRTIVSFKMTQSLISCRIAQVTYLELSLILTSSAELKSALWILVIGWLVLTATFAIPNLTRKFFVSGGVVVDSVDVVSVVSVRLRGTSADAVTKLANSVPRAFQPAGSCSTVIRQFAFWLPNLLGLVQTNSNICYTFYQQDSEFEFIYNMLKLMLESTRALLANRLYLFLGWSYTFCFHTLSWQDLIMLVLLSMALIRLHTCGTAYPVEGITWTIKRDEEDWFLTSLHHSRSKKILSLTELLAATFKLLPN